MPNLNAVDSGFYQLVQKLKIIIKSGMRQNRNSAGVMNFLNRFKRIGIRRMIYDNIFRTLL